MSVTRQAGLGGGCYLFLLVVVLARQRTLAVKQLWVLEANNQGMQASQQDIEASWLWDSNAISGSRQIWRKEG